MIKQAIEQFLHSIGLDTYGFIPCRTFTELEEFYGHRKENKLENEFEEKEIEKRINPGHYLDNAKTILSIAFPYNYEGDKSQNGFSTYTKRLDYHRVVMQYLDQIIALIESLGGNAKGFVDSNTIPERYVAYLAGVGFIGRNNMLITKKYGSYVFLAEIIMDLELPCEDRRARSQIQKYEECGTCTRCYSECPSKSINKNRINPNICLSYITQKKEITDHEIGLLKGNVFGCDFCQLACPYNEKAERGTIKEFELLDYMLEEPDHYAAMNNKMFKEEISRTSCGWRGKNVIKRNAIINLHYNKKDITPYLGESDYINQYIERLKDKK